jgi:hypothetical protein
MEVVFCLMSAAAAGPYERVENQDPLGGGRDLGAWAEDYACLSLRQMFLKTEMAADLDEAEAEIRCLRQEYDLSAEKEFGLFERELNNGFPFRIGSFDGT